MLGPLRRAVAVAGDREAVTCGGLRLTYAETWERCRRLVGALHGLGVGRGDRVAIVAPNCHRYLEVYQAVPGAGMVLVPLNPRHSESELRRALDDAGATVLIVGRDVGGAAAGIDHVIDIERDYEAMLAAATPADLPVELSEDTLAGLFYTGGTTGASKGVMLSHRNLIANALHVQACIEFSPEMRFLVVAPMYHLAGTITVLASVWHGGLQSVVRSFDAAAVLDLVESERITATHVVPTMLAALNEEQLARPRDVSSLTLVAHGGSPIATDTLRRARHAFPGVELVHMYGTTETAPLATTMRHEELTIDTPRARSCGQPTVGVEVAVVAADGAPTPCGTVGEVVIRGDNVMSGYWNKPEQTAAVLVDGWYHTGDLGYLDEQSYLFLVDRAKDMIVTGAENVYSTEVEDVLYRHPAVLEAAVFGIPDERWGEAVHAVVVPRDGIPVTDAELVEHCRAAIAGYKVPKRIDLQAEPLPKSGAGKILKREMRAPFWAGRDTSIG